jgi:hypothetical protein
MTCRLFFFFLYIIPLITPLFLHSYSDVIKLGEPQPKTPHGLGLGGAAASSGRVPSAAATNTTTKIASSLTAIIAPSKPVTLVTETPPRPKGKASFSWTAVDSSDDEHERQDNEEKQRRVVLVPESPEVVYVGSSSSSRSVERTNTVPETPIKGGGGTKVVVNKQNAKGKGRGR